MLGVEQSFDEYLLTCRSVMDQIDQSQVVLFADHLFEAWETGRFVFVCGNGGAGSTAGHFAEDLLKSTLDPQEFLNDDARRFKVLSLSENTSSILAWANDEGFERIFVEQLKNFASPGDMLVSMSGSGNSRNVLAAVEWANRIGLKTWGLTGYDGGELGLACHHHLHIPINDMGIAQSLHLMLFHWVLDDLHARINGKGRHSGSAGRDFDRQERCAFGPPLKK
ncbi:MAG: SIS domain-containing protein [Planctomycetaceae bacterium]